MADKNKMSTDVVNNIISTKIKELSLFIDCDHKWRSGGHGYVCTECDYYTGQEGVLNQVIKLELAK